MLGLGIQRTDTSAVVGMLDMMLEKRERAEEYLK